MHTNTEHKTNRKSIKRPTLIKNQKFNEQHEQKYELEFRIVPEFPCDFKNTN